MTEGTACLHNGLRGSSLPEEKAKGKEVDPTGSMVLLDEGQGEARLPGTLEGKVTEGL